MDLKTGKVMAKGEVAWLEVPREALSPNGRYAILKEEAEVYLRDKVSGEKSFLFRARYLGRASWTPDGLKAAVIASPEPFKSQLWLVETNPPKARVLLELEGEV